MVKLVIDIESIKFDKTCSQVKEEFFKILEAMYQRDPNCFFLSARASTLWVWNGEFRKRVGGSAQINIKENSEAGISLDELKVVLGKEINKDEVYYYTNNQLSFQNSRKAGFQHCFLFTDTNSLLEQLYSLILSDFFEFTDASVFGFEERPIDKSQEDGKAATLLGANPNILNPKPRDTDLLLQGQSHVSEDCCKCTII